MPAQIPITCLVGNTLITLADGSKKRIDQLKNGDKILTFNFETQQNVADEIRSISCQVHSNFVRIGLDYHNEINCTPDHPFYSDGWVSVNPYRTEMYYNDIDSAAEIKKGMFLKEIIGSIKVLKIERYTKKQDTYHISALKKNKTYYANGLLTSIEKNERNGSN